MSDFDITSQKVSTYVNANINKFEHNIINILSTKHPTIQKLSHNYGHFLSWMPRI